MKINKLICLVLLLLMFLITGCNKSNNQNEEEGFKLPTEDSVSQKLGGNYAFTLEFNGHISFTTKYIVTENGYYVEYLSDDGDLYTEDEEYAYLYLVESDELYYGTKFLLNKKSDKDLFGLGNGLDYLAFFADTNAEEEREALVGGRECIKYVIDNVSTYTFSCYIDKETGACLRCVARSNDDYYEWTVKDLVIGGKTLTEQIKKINISK